jgi:prevent-host-death family protein
MHSVGAFEAKTHFSALLKEVEKGSPVVITKNGRPVAKMIPIKGISKESSKDAIQNLKIFCKLHTLKGIDWKKLRDEGRK